MRNFRKPFRVIYNFVKNKDSRKMALQQKSLDCRQGFLEI